MPSVVIETYLLIIGLWLVMLWIIAKSYNQISPISRTLRLLLIILAIDAVRNIIENVYFGFYFSSHYGFIDSGIGVALGNPWAVVCAKIANIVAACLIIGVLLLRWLPLILKERNADDRTGLPNHSRLEADLAQLAASSPSKTAPSHAVVVFEIHGYRDVTDGLGHTALASLKLAAAKRLKTFAPTSVKDIYSPRESELALILTGTPRAEVISFLEQALRRPGERLEAGSVPFLITLSAGVAFSRTEGSAASRNLLSKARLASRDASLSGGGYYSIYSPILATKAKSRIQLDAELQQAYINGHFVLHYQPQVSLKDGILRGAEALLRWQHPTRGLLTPAEFIEALSNSPIAPDVGRWILHTACSQAAAWQKSYHTHFRIGVNLFPCQFYDGQLVRDVQDVLTETGITPDTLEIEITENVVLDSDESALATMSALSAIGVSLAVDDFGTGHASLMHLEKFPLNRIKIDRDFVAGIESASPRKLKALVTSIISMARSLDLEVIAEGIEVRSQAVVLEKDGCHEGQGYLFSPPIEAAAFKERFIDGVSPLVHRTGAIKRVLLAG